MNSQKTGTVVFITGAFVTNHCWDQWKSYFDSKGYKTLAPAWPHKDASADELRKKHPDQNIGLARLRLNAVIEYYANIIRNCDEKPIVIGHSLGGLITQVLVNRDLPAAGVAIHSVPPLGVVPYEPSFLRATWKSLGLFTSSDTTYLMSFKDWQYAFVNGLPKDKQKATYETYTIPESKRVIRDGLTGAAKVDFKKPHPPLLLISGSDDKIIPAHLNERNYQKYKKNGSVLDYKEFPGRNHFVLGLENWKEEAHYILDWIARNQRELASSS